MKDRVPQGAQQSRGCADFGFAREAELEKAADSANRQAVVLKLAEVKRALAESRREMKAACQRIETLTNANSQLKSDLTHLAHKEAKTYLRPRRKD